jgi:hypothetical protein
MHTLLVWMAQCYHDPWFKVAIPITVTGNCAWLLLIKYIGTYCIISAREKGFQRILKHIFE